MLKKEENLVTGTSTTEGTLSTVETAGVEGKQLLAAGVT
jgi:hypothetical protein